MQTFLYKLNFHGKASQFSDVIFVNLLLKRANRWQGWKRTYKYL